MAKGLFSRLMIVLYSIATLFIIIGLYVFTLNKYIGIGIIVLAIVMYIMPMTRQRY